MSENKFFALSAFAKNSRFRILITIIALSLVLVNITTVLIPASVAVWVLNVPIIAISLFTMRPKVPIYLAAFSAAWIFFDLFFIEEQLFLSEVLVRRTIGVIAYFGVAFITRYAILANLNEEKTRLALENSVRDLAKEKLKVERSNRELEQFAGVAAHDLRSPIATIFTWADMLNHLIPPPRSAELDQAVSIIRSNAKKAGDLVDDVLEIARVNVSTSRIDQVDLNRTLSEILLTLQQEIKDAQAKIQLASLPVVQGNQTYLSSIFSNLIRNALIYRDKTRTPEITVGCAEQIDSYEFFVKDNGIGIDPLFTGRIFEMFKRLNSEKEYPGTGIGLAFCKKVVELSGGKIWVDSLPGRGSTFLFTYPKVWNGGDKA